MYFLWSFGRRRINAFIFSNFAGNTSYRNKKVVYFLGRFNETKLETQTIKIVGIADKDDRLNKILIDGQENFVGARTTFLPIIGL